MGLSIAAFLNLLRLCSLNESRPLLSFRSCLTCIESHSCRPACFGFCPVDVSISKLSCMSANPSPPANPKTGEHPGVEIRAIARAPPAKSNQITTHHQSIDHQLVQLTTTTTSHHLPVQPSTCPNCASERTRRRQVPMPRPVRTLPPPRPLVSSNRTSATEGISMRPPSMSCGRSVRRSSDASSCSLVCPQ